jgi:septal ring factor EnvC (AmiA/AmiB activator)
MPYQTGSRRFGRTALLASATVAALLSFVSAPALAADTSSAALQQAQLRLRGADENLNRAKEESSKAEKRVKEALEANEKASREAEEAKSKLDRARADQEGAKAALAQAQGQYDQARAVIEDIYRARQGAPQ